MPIDNDAISALCAMIAAEQDSINRASYRLGDGDWSTKGVLFTRTAQWRDTAILRRDELIAKLRREIGG